MRERFSNFRARFPKSFADLKTTLSQLDPDTLVSRAKEIASSGQNYSNSARYVAAALATYFLADTVSLFTDNLVPEPPVVPPPPAPKKIEKRPRFEDYQSIISRNIFNSKGLIPEEEGEGIDNAPAKKTTLPLNLIGTVVLKNELKSIAAIEDKSQNMVFPVRVDDLVADKIKVTKIEHLRVYFINKSTGHTEYVEIVEDIPTLLQTKTAATAPTPSAKKITIDEGISKTDDAHYEIERSYLDKALGNLGEVLQQARAIPNFENGVQDGFKILQITPGSIFEKIGMKNGDVLCGINGESINDAGKAVQLFQDLKSAKGLDLCLKRNGKTLSTNYDIR